MRELVWIAGHIEHRNSERKLQVGACLKPTPIWGSLLNLSHLFVDKRVCCALVCATHSRLNRPLNPPATCECWQLLIGFVCSTRDDQIAARCSSFRPQIRREHSLNLSILLSEGKENNNDSLSNGEWTGKSSVLKHFVFGAKCRVTYMSCSGGVRRV